jgi:hypothetical protein
MGEAGLVRGGMTLLGGVAIRDPGLSGIPCSGGGLNIRPPWPG